MAVVRKHGRLVDIPVRSRTVVKLRESRSGRVIDSSRAIVLKNVPPSDFSRAYGRQVFVCQVFSKNNVAVHETGAGDLYPVGVARRIPGVCKRALAEYLRRR